MLINQRVADEIAALVARHRHGVADAREELRAAAAESQRRGAELRAAAAGRLNRLREESAQRNEGSARAAAPRRPRRDSEIRLESEFEDCEPEPPRPPRPAPEEEDEDFSTRSWLT